MTRRLLSYQRETRAIERAEFYRSAWPFRAMLFKNIALDVARIAL